MSSLLSVSAPGHILMGTCKTRRPWRMKRWWALALILLVSFWFLMPIIGITLGWDRRFSQRSEGTLQYKRWLGGKKGEELPVCSYSARESFDWPGRLPMTAHNRSPTFSDHISDHGRRATSALGHSRNCLPALDCSGQVRCPPHAAQSSRTHTLIVTTFLLFFRPRPASSGALTSTPSRTGTRRVGSRRGPAVRWRLGV